MRHAFGGLKNLADGKGFSWRANLLQTEAVGLGGKSLQEHRYVPQHPTVREGLAALVVLAPTPAQARSRYFLLLVWWGDFHDCPHLRIFLYCFSSVTFDPTA
jgi:hypothetical protein